MIHSRRFLLSRRVGLICALGWLVVSGAGRLCGAETVAAYVPFETVAEAQAVAGTLPPMEAGDAGRVARMNFFMNGSSDPMRVAGLEAPPDRSRAFQVRHPMQQYSAGASDVTWAMDNVVNQFTKEEVASWVPEQTPDLLTPNPRTHVVNWKWSPSKPDVITDRSSGEDFPNAEFPENQVGYGITAHGEVVEVRFWLDPSYAGSPYDVELAANSGRYDQNIFNGRYYFSGMRDYLRNLWMLSTLDKLTKAYHFSGDPVFAEYAKEILVKYAERYRFMLGTRRTKTDRIGSYVYNPMLGHIGSAMVLLQRYYRDTGYAVGVFHYQHMLGYYDRIYRDDTLNEEVPGTGMSARDFIEEKMFVPMVAFEWDSRPLLSDLSSNIGDFGYNTVRAAIILGRPDLARFGVEYMNLNVTGGLAGSDRLSVEGPGYHFNWWSNPRRAAMMMANYEDPPGYLDEHGTHLSGRDYRLVRNFARIRESHRVFYYPDGRPIPVHDVQNHPPGTPKGGYCAGPIGHSVTRIGPGFGHTLLGDHSEEQQIQAHLHWSGGGSHTHRDDLSIGMYAFGREVYGDPGYNWSSQGRSAVGHNTVMVDGNTGFSSGLGEIGNLHYLAPNLPGMKVTRVDHLEGRPDTERYRRTLALNTSDPDRPYLVDVFEVFGGDLHEWLTQGSMRDPMTVTTNLPGAGVQPYDVGSGPSYLSHLTSMQTGAVAAGTVVTMSYADDANQGVKLHLAHDGTEDLELLFGESPVYYDSQTPSGGEPGLKTSKMLLRRKGPGTGNLNTVFVVVHEPFTGGAGRIVSVDKNLVESGGVPVELGLTIVFDDGRTDYHLISLDSREAIDLDESRPMALGPLSADAAYAAAVTDGADCDLYVIGGTQASCLGKQVSSPEAMVTGTLLGVQRSCDLSEYDEDGFVSDIILPAGNRLDHEMIQVDYLNADGTVKFVAGYEIKSVEPHPDGVFIAIHQDANIAWENGMWRQLSPTNAVREAAQVRLRYVPGMTSVPVARIGPDMGRWELERPSDTLPVLTDDITVDTRHGNGEVQVGVDVAPAGTAAPSQIVSAGQITSSGTMVNARADNLGGVMESPVVSQHFRNMMAANPPGGATYPGLFCGFSQGGGAVVPDLRLPEVGRSDADTYTFHGYLDVPATGIYRFRYLANEAVMTLDGQEVADSRSDFVLPRELGVALAAGRHAFAFSLAWNDTYEWNLRTMGDFYLQWMMPGMSVYETIPEEAYSHDATGPLPSVAMQATPDLLDPATWVFTVVSSDDGSGGTIPEANIGWDVDGDGRTDFFGAGTLTYPFPVPGDHTVRVVVINASGERATSEVTVHVPEGGEVVISPDLVDSAFVRGGVHADTPQAVDGTVDLKNAGSDYCRIGMMKADLSPVAGVVESAILRVYAEDTAAYTLHVFGVRDAAGFQDWTGGAAGTATWNSVSANGLFDPVRDLHSLGHANLVPLGVQTLPGDLAGDVLVSVSGPALVDLLNEDTDGLATFVFAIDANTKVAVRPHDYSTAPSLDLTMRAGVHRVIYTAGAGGTISGETAQSVGNGGDASPVTAIPGAGHYFTGWSDGLTGADRADAGVGGDLIVTANFAEIPVLEFVGHEWLPGDSGLRIELRDPAGQPLTPNLLEHYLAEASETLLPDSWTPLPGGLTLDEGVLVLDDPDAAGLPCRFYRIRGQASP